MNREKYREQFKEPYFHKWRTRDEEQELEEDVKILLCQLLGLHVSSAGKVSTYDKNLKRRVETNEVCVKIDKTKIAKIYEDENNITLKLEVSEEAENEIGAMWDNTYLEDLAHDCEGEE